MASPQHFRLLSNRPSLISGSFHPSHFLPLFPTCARFYADFFPCQEESREKVKLFLRGRRRGKHFALPQTPICGSEAKRRTQCLEACLRRKHRNVLYALRARRERVKNCAEVVPLLPWVRREPQIGNFAQQIALVSIQSAHELRIVQRLLALLRRHSRQHAHFLRQHPLALWRQGPPARRNVANYFLALLRREPPENLQPPLQGLALLRRHAVPALQSAPNLLLPPRRKVLKLPVVAHEPFLLLGRHFLQFFNPFRGQAHGAAHAGTILLPLHSSLRPRPAHGPHRTLPHPLASSALPKIQPCRRLRRGRKNHQQPGRNASELKDPLHRIFICAIASSHRRSVAHRSLQLSPVPSPGAVCFSCCG